MATIPPQIQAQAIQGFPVGMMMGTVPAQMIQPGFPIQAAPLMMPGFPAGVPQQVRPTQMGYYGAPTQQYDLLGQFQNLNLN